MHIEPRNIHVKQTYSTTQPVTGVLLYVRVVLTIMVVLVSLGLLIFCMRRTNNNKGKTTGDT